MAKISKKMQIKAIHIAMFIVLGFIIYLSIDSIANFAKNNEILSAILFVAIIATPAYLHFKFLFKKRKK